GAHAHHDALLRADGKRVIDLTPAAIGPYVIPPVNLDEHLEAPNINMVTCGGQATIPIVAAVASVATVHYAEIIASISSRSAGPGTRANIDEFTETTARAIEVVGGAARGKAIIILNPAEPPMIMRDTVICLADSNDREAIVGAVKEMVQRVSRYVPGYRLKQEVQFNPVTPDTLDRMGISGLNAPLQVSVFLEVEGAGHYLPNYAGNLDIMTSAALRAAEEIAARIKEHA
ncbi:MAG: acetaldehyde dehydrogenase (acetylating), partial [Rhodobacteraceae bacterium]|nr:acetaldehyde dehydrogenase (acetylating) [Paracoccaceae bacterium]